MCVCVCMGGCACTSACMYVRMHVVCVYSVGVYIYSVCAYSVDVCVAVFLC